MLAQRIATALILLVVLVATLAASSVWPFAILMLLMVAACAWEWGRLSGGTQTVAVVLAVITAGVALLPMVLASGAWPVAQDHATAWRMSAVAWLLGGALVLRLGVQGWRGVPRVAQWLAGVVILVTVWWAVVIIRGLGINFLLSTMSLVWASDIAAYFGGKAWGGRIFGGRRLAPSISPGKTWEGAVSGLVGTVVLALLWTLMADRLVPVDGPSLYSRLVADQGWIIMILAVVVLTFAGIMGDLFESLVKRAAGAKDSSRLLPGHGGVLDRVDALLPVLPIAVALVS